MQRAGYGTAGPDGCFSATARPACASRVTPDTRSRVTQNRVAILFNVFVRRPRCARISFAGAHSREQDMQDLLR